MRKLLGRWLQYSLFPALLEYCEWGGYAFFLLTFKAKAFFEKSHNATFISLIPKFASVVDTKNFRPISFEGSVYKILAKVLASRLTKVVGKIKSPNQYASILGH